jgi:dipeptidyl aminopeptidase/acylaminoacyl peptidase
MRILLTFIFVFTAGFTLGQQTISHETMWLMKRVGAPKISPDGKWVIYSVTEPAYDEKETIHDIWIVAADGSSKPRKLTSGKAGENSYTWSPDGNTIAFTAKRDGEETTQVYLLDLKNGGEAQRFTSTAFGASNPEFSPDGKHIAFTAKLYPGTYNDSTYKKENDDRKKIKYRARVYTSFPIRSWDQWLDEKQTQLFIQHIDSSKPVNLFEGIEKIRQPGCSYGGEIAFSPDGRSILVDLTENRQEAAFSSVITNIYSIDLSEKTCKQLTNDKADFGSLQFSRDGKYLFSIYTPTANFKVYNQPVIVRYDWPSMANKKIVTAAVDRPINSYELTENKVIASVEDQGFDRIFQFGFDGKSSRLSVSAKGSFNNISLSDNGIITALFESSIQPAEVVRIKSNGEHEFISHHNDEALKNLQLNSVESFWHTSARGKKIHSFLVKPAGFDPSKKYPLFVLIHGGPAASFKDNFGYRWNPQLIAAPGYVILMTNYTGSPGYGEKFAQDIQYDPFKGPATEINEAAASAIKQFSWIDGNRQAAGGASYGGHLSNWLQGTTSHYKCLVSHAGLVNSEAQWGTSDAIYHREVMAGGPPWMQTKTWKDQNPIRLANNFKTPVLVTVGENDFRVPLNNSLEYYSALQRMKVPSKLIVFPEENHWILKPENSRFFYKELKDWLGTYLK